MSTNRREFIARSGVLGAATLTGSVSQQATANYANTEVKSYRRLGRTNLEISDISMGTSRLRTGEENLVEHALERGINYLDTAESYTGGQSETVIGNVLNTRLKGKRDQIYLVSKTLTRSSTDADTMMRDLEGSLRRLQTDYVDIYMNHAVNDTGQVGNPEWAEFVEKAKQQGKIRFTGISGHAAHQTFIEFGVLTKVIGQ